MIIPDEDQGKVTVIETFEHSFTIIEILMGKLDIVKGNC